VADLQGVETAPPPLGRWTDAVTVLLISENGTVFCNMPTPSPVINRLQKRRITHCVSVQSSNTSLYSLLAIAKFWSLYCKTCASEYSKWLHQWLSHSFRVHQICFRPDRAPPRTPLGSFSAPQTPCWFKGLLLV